MTKLCKMCGRPFEPTSNAQTICENIHYRNCEVCGTPFVIKRPTSSQLCCSKECTRKKREATIEAKYGTPYPLRNPELRKKMEDTNTERFGTPYAAQSKVIKDKMKQKFQDTYGVDWPFQMEDFKEKSKQTCLKKYNVEFVTQSDIFKQKGEAGCLQKYGVRRPMQSPEFHTKSAMTRKSIRAEDGTPLDSLYEKTVYDFWKSLGLEVERNIPVEFEYEGKHHTTLIDFKVNGILFEIKGLPYIQGVYDYAQVVPIDKKLEIYRQHHVILITDNMPEVVRLFGTPNSKTSNGLKYLNKCPNPQIGVDIKLFCDNPDFPYAEDRPKCFYDVKVDGKRSAHEAFYDPQIRWNMISNRIQYSGGFIDARQVLTAMNVTRTCKQPSWFSADFATKLLEKYCTSDTVVDPFAGWGGRYVAAHELGKIYIGVDLNPALVEWHKSQGRDIELGDANTFTFSDKCTVFICPPYQDKEVYFESQNSELTQCQWLAKIMKNIPNANEYIMVCKVVDSGWDKYIVETKENKSHFGVNKEYVLVVRP